MTILFGAKQEKGNRDGEEDGSVAKSIYSVTNSLYYYIIISFFLFYMYRTITLYPVPKPPCA